MELRRVLFRCYVEEEGENEHGYFIRWSDGKQEVWCNPISQVPNVRSGQIYRSEREEVTYPKPFLRRSMVSINARVSSFDRWADSNDETLAFILTKIGRSHV